MADQNVNISLIRIKISACGLSRSQMTQNFKIQNGGYTMA